MTEQQRYHERNREINLEKGRRYYEERRKVTNYVSLYIPNNYVNKKKMRKQNMSEMYIITCLKKKSKK